ncbi:NUDIX hydrolase [Bacillus litorisediminis]|uniref:NUDIX hydrolase n=1 Tax=Bacillus litorisediminis TaxID=2922713 RepID=UPI0036F273ED
MLFRNKEPNKGRWNGVGGKIEPNETPYESCIREVYEETGLTVVNQVFRGIISFRGIESICLFVCDEFTGDLIESDEGILEWKSIEWILHSNHVVPNIPLFIEEILDFQNEPKIYDCIFTKEGKMTSFQTFSLNKERVYTYSN